MRSTVWSEATPHLLPTGPRLSNNPKVHYVSNQRVGSPECKPAKPFDSFRFVDKPVNCLGCLKYHDRKQNT